MLLQRHLIISIIITGLFCKTNAIIDPITIGSVIGAAAVSGLLGGGLYIMKCKISECCEKEHGWVLQDFTGLEEDISRIVHGQHLVKDIVLKSLRSHWLNESPKKALVMSFHGPTGTGKNYVSSLIMNRLFRKGAKSDFVKLWIGKLDFPHESEKNHYIEVIQNTIKEKVAKCPRSLFIIDEMDAISSGVIDGLKPYLDYYENINGVDYRKAVFIFLSNTGSNDISNLVFKKLENGEKREDVTLKDFQIYIENGAFNEKGGLNKAKVIANGLIDVFVPFLPLEVEQVKQCIRDILFKKRCPNVDSKTIESIAREGVTYSPPGYEYFSRSGCKQLENTVALRFNHPCIHNRI